MTPEQSQYIDSLIGKPWVNGAYGPDGFDCWGLAREVESKLFGREMPKMEVNADDVRDVIRVVASTPHRKCWKRIDAPVHGCIVEMAHSRHPYHVGVYLEVDGGGVLHCQNPSGVCFDRIATLQASGWRKFFYNDWIG